MCLFINEALFVQYIETSVVYYTNTHINAFASESASASMTTDAFYLGRSQSFNLSISYGTSLKIRNNDEVLRKNCRKIIAHFLGSSTNNWLCVVQCLIINVQLDFGK